MGNYRYLQLMNRLYVPPEKRLSRDAVISLIIHWFFQFGASMSGVFLNLYLWRLTESLWINGMYNVIIYAVTPIAFAVGGKLAKKRDRLVTYRLGITMISVFYLLVVLSGESVAEWFWLFAIFNGFAAAFYWTGYLTIMYDVSTDQNRIRYLAVNMIVFTSAGLIGPALAGFLIVQFEGLFGYIIVFTISFLMFAITVLFSFRLSPAPSKHKTYYLKFMGLLIRKNKPFRMALFAFFFYGTLQGIMLFLPNLLLYRVLPKEDLVGYLGVFFSLVTIASSYAISRFAKESKARLYVLAAAVGMTGASIMLSAGLTVVTVISYIVMYSFFFPLLGNTMSTYYYRLIGELPLKGHLRIESVVIREVFVNLGRVVAIFTLISLAQDLEAKWLSWVIICASLTQFVVLAFMGRRTVKTE